jgi:hypothetical protein
MPTKDTKTITIRVPKEEYYQWLELASKNQQPISTYLKSCLDISKAPIQDSKSFKPPRKKLNAYKLTPVAYNGSSVLFFPDTENYNFYGFWLHKLSPVDRSHLYTKINDSKPHIRAIYHDNGQMKFWSTNSKGSWEECLDVERTVIDVEDIGEQNIVNGFQISFKIKI